MIKRLFGLLIVPLILISTYNGYALAITQSDLKAIISNQAYYEAVDSCSVASTGATSIEGGSTEENKKIIWQYLTGKGLTPEQTAGLMGNLQAEGGFEPRRVEYGPPWKNSRGEMSIAGTPSSLDDNVPPDQATNGSPGYGIVQWTFPTRKQGLRDLAQERGVKAGDLGLQLDYLWKELTVNYKKTIYKPLQEATTIEEASKIIVTKFERPRGYETQKIQDQRAEFGKRIYKQFIGTEPGAASFTTTNSSCGQTRSDTGSRPAEFIYYAQDGPEYNEIKIPGSNTIGSSGCGITSFAMAIANLTNNPSVTPKTIVDNLTDYPETTRGEWLVNNFGSQFGVKGKLLNNIDEVVSSLKQGNYVITGGSGSNGSFNETGKPHIVLLTGVDDENNITVANPLIAFKNKSSFTSDQVKNWSNYYMEVSK